MSSMPACRRVAFGLFAFLALSVSAAERVALVIGNNDYPDVPLANAVRDAQAVREMLTGKLGFSEPGVVFVENADRLTIFEKFEAFKKVAAKAEIVVVYYAGHGMESLDGKENFLLPVDTPVARAAESEAALRASGVNLMALCADLAEATGGAKVVLMDCCRERPAGRGASRAGGGLVTYADGDIPADTLMILAAAPNRVASDGAEHGPFTEALIEVLPGNGGNLMEVFFAVSDRVRQTTEQTQVPWLKFDGSGAIFRERGFLGRGVPAAVKVAEPDPAMSEAEIERRAKAMAEKLVADAMKKSQPAPAAPSVPSVPSSPMVKTDPAPAPAFPASRGMEGSRAGEVREFGGIEMVWCPPGKFTMGSPEGEAGRFDNEIQHEVTLTRGFWLAKTETTQGQWEGAMGNNPSKSNRGESFPVETVSWDDAQGWLAKMNAQHPLPEGWKWELPTEAQWEYACRAGTEGACAGSGDLKEMGWYFDNSEGNDGRRQTWKVGLKKANDWGLHDMHGNVWELCRDYYGDYPVVAVTDPTGATTDSGRVIRGGGWGNGTTSCRSANRFVVTPVDRYGFLGFRAAVVPAGR